jgi:hypothetical protein
LGNIKLSYAIDQLSVEPADLALEIEKGITFALYHKTEKMILPRKSALRQISCELLGSQVTLVVADDFFNVDSFFETIFTTFLYNLQDFGTVKMMAISFDHSQLDLCAPCSNPVFQQESKPLLGTVFKPYYLPLNKKIAMAELFLDQGFRVAKEDETYLASREQITEAVRAMNSATSGALVYVPNITAYTCDYHFIEKLLGDGLKVAMVNFLVAGLGNVFRLKTRYPELNIWGHRVGYERLKAIISMRALSALAVQAGIDFLHIGTPRGEPELNESSKLTAELISFSSNFKAVFTKTTPEIIPPLVEHFKGNAVIMGCGYFRANDGVSIDPARVKEWVASAK